MVFALYRRRRICRWPRTTRHWDTRRHTCVKRWSSLSIYIFMIRLKQSMSLWHLCSVTLDLPWTAQGRESHSHLPPGCYYIYYIYIIYIYIYTYIYIYKLTNPTMHQPSIPQCTARNRNTHTRAHLRRKTVPRGTRYRWTVGFVHQIDTCYINGFARG